MTGASRGIGRAVAEAALNAGGQVIVTATGPDPADWIRQHPDFGGRLVYWPVDFTDGRWQAAISDRLAAVGRVDVCINNAGINKIGDVRTVPAEDARRIFEVNLVAPLVLTGLVATGMAAAGYGRIVNISSIFGIGSRAGRISYSSSKAGLLGQTRAAALDLAGDGILVNAVAPGFVRTELTERVLGPEGMAEAARRLPVQRLAEVSDIVPPVLFLASRLNTYITGQVLPVDGGYLAE